MRAPRTLSSDGLPETAERIRAASFNPMMFFVESGAQARVQFERRNWLEAWPTDDRRCGTSFFARTSSSI